MATLTVHDYTAFILNQSTNQHLTRVLVAPNTEIAHQLLHFHIERGMDVVRVCDCIQQKETTWLPMPDEIFGRIDESVRQLNGEAVVVGLDAYLALIENQYVQTAFARLRQLMDKEDYSAVFIVTGIWLNNIWKIFKNPKYEAGRKVIFFTGDTEIAGGPPNVILVGKEWAKLKPPVCESFKDYLLNIGDFTTTTVNTVTIGLPLHEQPIAGLNPAIKQIVTLADYMRSFYNVDDEIPETVLQWIFKQVHERKCSSGLEAVRQSFGLDADLLRVAPKRLVTCHDEVEGTAWLWMLRKTIKQDSYLQRVISLPNLTLDNFLQGYVVDGALACMGDSCAEQLALERRAALREIDVPYEAHIIRLIAESANKPIQDVAIWLNNETSYEHTELVRRCATLDLTDNVPDVVLQVYPLLADYIVEYSYGNPELDAYFKLYRKLKLLNIVTPEFCHRAFNATVPRTIQSRDAIIQPYSMDGKSALLVVDGMGAEYLPVLLAQAKKHQIGIIRYEVATCCLPTSTKYNSFIWPSERRLQDIKRIDGVIHAGAKANEPNTYAENLVAVLDEMIAKRIFERIADGLTRYEQVVVTSDHGASRLALLAYENNLAQTLPNPSDKEIIDWRYTNAPENKTCPEEMEDTLDGKYWVVRGYNRLPKSGGKKNELHGGATLEERLVPVIVFKKGAVLESQTVQPIKSVEQLVEKDDFDL
jgi:hypothetical protein